MKRLEFIPLFLIIGLITACKPVPLPPTDFPLENTARNTLIQFFADLNNAEYEDAALHYGGSYEILQGYNPDIDPGDKIALLTAGCERNGLLCMQLMTAEQVSVENGLIFHYKVSYRAPDNTEFVLGPCCGASETEMPPVRYFDVTVSCDQQDVCLVMDLPPYVP
jgi:hypothetical protein